MNYLEYELLKNRDKEFTKEEQEECFAVIEYLTKLNLVALREGLLALEEYVSELEDESIANRFMKEAVLHASDGVAPENLEMFLSRDIVFYGADTFQGYLCYLIMKGIRMIQAGYSCCMLEKFIKHCLPFSLREEAVAKMNAITENHKLEWNSLNKESVENWTPKETDNLLFQVVLDKLYEISDDILQKYVQSAKQQEFTILLAYVPKSLRNHMLTYASPTVKESILANEQVVTNEEISKVFCSVLSSLKRLEQEGKGQNDV